MLLEKYEQSLLFLLLQTCLNLRSLLCRQNNKELEEEARLERYFLLYYSTNPKKHRLLISVDILCMIKVKPSGPFAGILLSYKFLSAEIVICVSVVLSKARPWLWDYLVWLEHDARDTWVVCSIPMWAFHLRAGLEDLFEMENFSISKYSVICDWSLLSVSVAFIIWVLTNDTKTTFIIFTLCPRSLILPQRVRNRVMSNDTFFLEKIVA